jgi:Holliday junction resolvasome RuvABC endonuclease subunit
MRIMGADLSITRTGLAFPAGETMAVKPRSKGDGRLHEITHQTVVSVRAARPDLVMIEDIQGQMKGAANKVIPMLHGAVRYALMEMGVPYMVINPSSLKSFATGSGSADKLAMRMAAKTQLGRTYPTDDECDAAWLRVAGMAAYDVPVRPTAAGTRLTFPDARLSALQYTGRGKARKALEWPVVGAYTAFVLPHSPGLALLCTDCASQGRAVCA